MNSFGAYWASVATSSVPFVFIAAGTSAATVAFSAADVDVVAVGVDAVELVLVLLLPQPASTSTVSTGMPMRAISLLIGTPFIALTVGPQTSRGRASMPGDTMARCLRERITI